MHTVTTLTAAETDLAWPSRWREGWAAQDAAQKTGNVAATGSSRRLRLFIAYRQGATQGDACALWLHQKLSGATLESDSEGTAKLETYLDVRSPALGNWTEK